MPQIEADFKERYNQRFIPNKTEHFKCSECSNESKCVCTLVCVWVSVLVRLGVWIERKREVQLDAKKTI